MESSEARRLNKGAVLRVLVTSERTSRQEVAAATGLSKATVSRLVRQLLTEGLLVEGPIVSTPDGGRTTQLIEFRGDTGLVVGIDVGASNTRFILADLRAGLLRAWSEATPRTKPPRQLADWLAKSIRTVAKQPDSVLATVVGVPGAVAPRDGRIFTAPNLPQIEGADLADSLAQTMPGTVRLDNDSNLALVGELCAGAGTDTDAAVMFTIGTGLGAGVFVNGALLRGRNGLVGEFGAVPLGPDGTLEDVLSGRGISALGREYGLPGRNAKALLAGNTAQHQRLQKRVQHALFVACALACVAYEPAQIIVGGGVAPSIAHMLPDIASELASALGINPTISTGELGDYGGAIGALASALECAYTSLGATEGSVFDPTVRRHLARLAASVRVEGTGSHAEGRQRSAK